MSVEQQVTVIAKSGIHARPAAQIVKEAGRFQSELTIVTGQRSVNMKSLISMMTLGLKQGSEVIVRAAGPDEAEAAEAMSRLIGSELE